MQARRRIAIRLVAPIALVGTGVWLLVGCIYIPTFNAPQGQDASKKVGDEKSRKPLRTGSANRQDVERLLGPPRYVAVDGSEVAYVWTVQHGVVVNLCFQTNEHLSARAIVLRYEGDVLRGFRLEKDVSRLGRWMRERDAAVPQQDSAVPTTAP